MSGDSQIGVHKSKSDGILRRKGKKEKKKRGMGKRGHNF
jgi:hypothetical protein